MKFALKEHSPQMIIISIFIILLLVVIGIILGLGIYGFCFLFLSGLGSGIFYSLIDHRTFDYPYDDKFERMRLKHTYNNKNNRVNKVNMPALTNNALAHKFILHITCGIIGSIALYLLLTDKSIIKVFQFNKSVTKLTFQHLILFIIASLGYLGYLPRTFWFFAQKGGPAT